MHYLVRLSVALRTCRLIAPTHIREKLLNVSTSPEPKAAFPPTIKAAIDDVVFACDNERADRSAGHDLKLRLSYKLDPAPPLTPLIILITLALDLRSDHVARIRPSSTIADAECDDEKRAHEKSRFSIPAGDPYNSPNKPTGKGVYQNDNDKSHQIGVRANGIGQNQPDGAHQNIAPHLEKISYATVEPYAR